MPEIRDDEISLATCLAARWTVSVSCGGPCNVLRPLALEGLTRHPRFNRPLVWMKRDKPMFRCKACKSPVAAYYVSRPGDGPVFKVEMG